MLIAAMSRLSARPGDGADGPDGRPRCSSSRGRARRRPAALPRPRHGVADRVRFLGFVPDDDLPGLYRLADVFAIASQAELQSLATMAAMASGLPVVAVDAGALAELVLAGRERLPGQAAGMRAGEIADCLGLLCRDPGLRSRMAQASTRIIGDHDRHRLLTPVGIHLPRARVPRGSRGHVF